MDRYTKTVLTVIAAALVLMAAERLVPAAQAQPVSCGRDSGDPCYVAIANEVQIRSH